MSAGEDCRGSARPVAAIQMCSGDDLETNLRNCATLLEAAAGEDAGLAVLPENFSIMPADPIERPNFAETDGDGPAQSFVATQAERLGLWIVAGTIPIRSEDPARPRAACCVYDEKGRRVGRFDKLHLFDVDIPGGTEVYRESASTQPGASTLVIESPWGGLGIAVCYDLRFPEQFRAMARESLDIVAVPAAFTVPTGKAHWSLLLRARALDNLCYAVGAAQTGMHPGGRSTWGHSTIVGPWGQVLAEAGDAEQVITAKLDPDALQKLRDEFPVLAHRRAELQPGSAN